VPAQHCQDSTAKTGHLEQDSLKRIAETGQPEKESLNRTSRAGQEDDGMQNRKARTGLPGQDPHVGLLGLDFRDRTVKADFALI
jgi:hypothetical protein